MIESHRDNDGEKKPDTKQHILSDFIYMKFRNREITSMVFE